MFERSNWPASKVVIAIAWSSDLVWGGMVWLGSPAVVKTGLVGFVVSTVVFIVAKAKHSRPKADGA